MMIHSKKRERSAAVVVESAIVLPVALTVVFAIVAGAIAMFNYQQVAAIAREAARYAAVRGKNHNEDQGITTPTTQADVYNNCILPRLVDMDPSHLTHTVTWSPDQKQGSYVTVTLTYQMSVPIYGNLTFTSTAQSQMHW